MTSKQERKLRMYRAVRQYLIQENDVVKDLPYYLVRFEEFCALFDKIEETIQKQVIPRTGIAIDKKKRRIALVNVVVTNALRLKILAHNNNDMRLFNQADLSKSDIEDQRDLDLNTYAEIIFSEVETHIAGMKDYGTSTDTQKVFREKIDAFFEMIVSPRSAIAERSVETMQVADLMGKAYQGLLDLDILMGIIKHKRTDFYVGYKFVRKLVYTRGRRLALRARAIEAGTGVPVKGAIFTFCFTGSGNGKKSEQKDIIKKSAKKGGLLIHNMSAGTYTVVIKKPGYKEKTTPVVIVGGERTDLVVEMEKTG